MVFAATVLPLSYGLMWQSSPNAGEIPNTAITYFPPKTSSPIHFCQVSTSTVSSLKYMHFFLGTYSVFIFASPFLTSKNVKPGGFVNMITRHNLHIFFKHGKKIGNEIFRTW